MTAPQSHGQSAHTALSLATVLREWGRIGCIGFGGPPTHIKLLRELCVQRERWIEPVEFEDAVAACNLLPGPASTQLSIFCAWRVRGRLGALVGGAASIVPGLWCHPGPRGDRTDWREMRVRVHCEVARDQ